MFISNEVPEKPWSHPASCDRHPSDGGLLRTYIANCGLYLPPSPARDRLQPERFIISRYQHY